MATPIIAAAICEQIGEPVGNFLRRLVLMLTHPFPSSCRPFATCEMPSVNYTAVVRGKNAGIGVGLVEVYNLR